MKGYMKLTAALAAFALLLVVMGLSTQSTVNAQALSFATSVRTYVCSLSTCTDTNSTGIALSTGTGAVEVKNLDVAEVDGINPMTIQSDVAAITFVQQYTDTDNDGDIDADDRLNRIRAFNGNRVQLTYSPPSGFAITKTITVDNVKPTLVTNSPTIPLVVKGNVNVVFSADITDGGAGYTATVGTSGSSDIDDLNAVAGALDADLSPDPNTATPIGGVRLVVAGNVVNLTKSNFTKIDGGWTVSAEIGSSAIQNIGANVPWYFETRDRAGNTRRSSGSIALSPGTDDISVGGTTVRDVRFDAVPGADTGDGGLQSNSFDGSMMKVTRGSDSETVPISGFVAATGTFTLDLTSFFEEDTTTTQLEAALLAGDKFELVGSNLVSVDSKAPRLESGGVTTGIRYNSTTKMAVRGLMARANSMQVKFDDDGKADNDNAGSGLDAGSVTPAAFTVSGNTVSSVLVVGDDVYLTLGENLEPDEQPRVVIANGVIMDKAGNAFGGTTVSKAADGLGPNLSLSKDSDLSKEKVTVTITTDEQLANLPDVTLSRVINNDGDVVTDGDQECVYAAVPDPDSDPATDDALPRLVRALESDGTCLSPTAAADDDLNNNYAATTPSDVTGQPADSPNPSQTAALSYSYAVTSAIANPTTGEGAGGGKYNVYVEGVDTTSAEGLNKGSVGHKSDANNSAAFTFQLDTKLNGGIDPIVSVSDNEDVAMDDSDVEAVDPMIVTVNWGGESNEYPGDSYRTVTLTSAELTVRFADGSSDKTTFNLTTDVSTADNIKYTIPILNPKVGSYSLTVKGTDSAGNASGTTGHTASWEVVAAKPVNIDLQPGWNLISLPFQPGNPAINSVIPGTHPVDIVMTFDNATQTWLVSRRDAETGSFVGDIPVLTANTAYFVRTDKFQAIRLLRPPLATAAAAPPPPPAITVVEGWNLVPIVSNEIPTPKTIDADDYFGTLGSGANAGWLKALTFNTLVRTWDSVTPGNEDTVTVGKGYWLYATSSGVIIP